MEPTGQRDTLPAPIGGWNARDALDLMAPTDAIRLDNWFPGDSEVSVRNGFASHATGLGNNIETLLSYDGTGTKKMFGIAGTSLFECTAAGAVGAADVTGLTDAQWGSLMMATSGGPYLWMWNETASDAPYHYDGSTWAQPSLTGITSSDVIGAMVHKRRIFMVLNNSLKFGYLAVNTIAGAVTTFDLASQFKFGGTLVACGTWTRDGGAGADDLAVFLTSNGEVAVYSGTDPSTAATWSLVGVFKIGNPVGKRCLMKVGADLVVLTDAGVVPLSQVLQSGESAPTTAVTDKISGAFIESARRHGTTFGWQMILYPKGKYAFVNVPASGTTFYQYVVNLTTGAWCRFTGQDGYSWVVHNKELYFGTNGTVYKADSGSDDAGADIDVYGKTAFNYFNLRGVNKQFTMMRPVIGSTGDLTVSIGFDVDFRDGVATYTADPISPFGATWDEATWDVAEWDAPSSVIQEWRSIEGVGTCGSFRLKLSTSLSSVTWHATDVIWVPGLGL